MLFYVLLHLNHVIAIVRKHRKGHQSAVFHSSAEGTYKVSGVSQENVKGRKIAPKKALLDDNDPWYHQPWYLNGTQMSKMPHDYFETTNCQTNITEGWKIDACFVCVDETTSAEYGCKIHRGVDGSIVRSVYHGTNCDSGLKDEAVENFHSTECGPGVIYAAREIYDGTPYLVEDHEAAFVQSSFYDSCLSSSPFQYEKRHLSPIPGSSDYCFTEYDEDGTPYSTRFTPGCTWQHSYVGENCEGENEEPPMYYKDLYGMCYRQELSLEEIRYEGISFYNSYEVNPTVLSTNGKYGYTFGTSCKTASPVRSHCFAPTDQHCPFFENRYTLLDEETRRCKPGDLDEDGFIRYMAGQDGQIAIDLLLPGDAVAGEKFKFVVTLFDTARKAPKLRFTKATYTLDALDVADGSLSFELFDEIPPGDLSVYDSFRVKVKRHDPNPNTRPFVRTSCARYDWYDSNYDCSQFGDMYSSDNCEPNCHCCSHDGRCKECRVPSACDASTGACHSCYDLFPGDQVKVDECRSQVGQGYYADGVYLDNTCPTSR